MPVCNTPTNHDLAHFIEQLCEVEQSFSVLIHKSVENCMGQTSLFVEQSGSAFWLILYINYIAEEMDAK